MQHITKINVSLQFGKNQIEVGELVSHNRQIYFKYMLSFIKSGLEISPIKLKLNTDTHSALQLPFEGLFGVFADSLPDGWGRLLLDRALSAKGIAAQDLTVLDRLAYVGNSGMGALVYEPELESDMDELFQVELDDLAKATQHITAGTASDVLDELFMLGGSSGGARPKILVGYHPVSKHLINNQRQLPKGYEHWLIKFPSSFDRPDIANIEYAYYKMALAAGIEMSTCQLFKGKSGQYFFGTKRFDRQGNKRLHLHSAAGLMHDNFRLSALDYGHLMDAAFRLEKDVTAYEKVLRLATFNVLAHNRDDHSKNFSFLMDAQGNWQLAPAYDLTFSGSGHGMQSTTVAGEGVNPNKTHLLELAQHFHLKKARTIIDEVETAVYNWKHFAKACGVSSESMKLIEKTMKQSYSKTNGSKRK